MLNVVHFSGSHRDVGYQAGKQFADRIHYNLAENSELHKELIPYSKTESGKQRLKEFLELNRSVYPEIFQELKGIAEGADCSFRDLFIAHLRGELLPFSGDRDLAGCSTCSVNRQNLSIIGHNEDAKLQYLEEVFLAEVDIPGKPRFYSLAYPGFLFGNAVGWNAKSICFTINITASLSPRVGLGRYFTARSLLTASDLNEALNLIMRYPQSSGFNYTIGDISTQTIQNVEVLKDSHAVKAITQPYFHTNHYVHLGRIDQYISASSKIRYQEGLRLLKQNDIQSKSDVLNILTHRKNPDSPIYRTSRNAHETATLMCCIFNLQCKAVEFYPANQNIPKTLNLN